MFFPPVTSDERGVSIFKKLNRYSEDVPAEMNIINLHRIASKEPFQTSTFSTVHLHVGKQTSDCPWREKTMKPVKKIDRRVKMVENLILFF